MKPRKPNETDAQYISRLEHQNASLKQENERIKKWAGDLNEAVTYLSCDVSVAFQMMAEKAGVRGHPSVTKVVELLDVISHSQWRGEKKIPELKFPQFWDLDSPQVWSGDADMLLNSPIAEAVEFLETFKFGGQKKWEIVEPIINGLHKLARDGVEGVKDARGFKPKMLSIPSGRIQNMTREQLIEVVEAIGWMALDLAQDMGFANEGLRRDLRAATYRRIHADLYRMAWLGPEIPENTNISIKVIGGEQDAF